MTRNLLEAIKEKGNIFGLLLAIVLAIILQDWRWLLAGLICEAAYLMWMPGSRWYQAILNERLERDSEKRRQYLRAQSLPNMRSEMRKRYIQLEEARRRVSAQYRSDPICSEEMLRNLDFLLETFLAFGAKEQEFRNYMQSLLIANRRNGISSLASRAPISLPSTMPDSWIPQVIADVRAGYAQSLARLEQAVEQDCDPDSKAILAKRIEIAHRRLEYAGKIGRTLANLSSQLHLIEETFGLVSDELLLWPPMRMLSDIEEVIAQAGTMAKTLEEVGAIDQMTMKIG